MVSEGSDDIKGLDLDELESQLTQIASVMDNEGLESQVLGLKQRQTDQQRLINHYKAEIDHLEKDVDNIEQIKNMLPQQCFNVVKIEGQR